MSGPGVQAVQVGLNSVPQGGLWSPEVVAARGREGVCGEGVVGSGQILAI